ncbi:MAG: type II toxin-antitoxin system Phd/YefM family antitoxin [Treponema sp.]|jgi:prevent-host-death family protein|nr:type II toxin-antitoxin system Phd/YefM family antitoxin [Treponema sp.]
MSNIRPVSDLRNNFSEISKVVHETQEPVFLTKNGYGDMVVMSMEAYEDKLFESEIYDKLKEAEFEAKTTKTRISHEVVFSKLRSRITEIK